MKIKKSNVLERKMYLSKHVFDSINYYYYYKRKNLILKYQRNNSVSNEI